MSGHANRGLGALGHAVRLACAETIARARRLPIGTIALVLVAVAWMATSGWWAFVYTRSEEAAAIRYQTEVAKCRELATSEARYDCVSRALISRDRENFGKTMLVFIPPLVLLFGRYIWREMRAAVRERERERQAEERSRHQLAQLRRELMAEKEALKPAKRADWNIDTTRAEEIAHSPRGPRATEPHPHDPAPTAPHAVKRA